MSPFYGREYELRELSLLCMKKSASMVALTGRRRIGKSRLITEFANRASRYRLLVISGLPPSEQISDKKQRENFASHLEKEIGIPPVKSDDWQDLFDHLANNTTRGKWIIHLDEITWMGSKDPSFLGKLKNTWDLKLKKNQNIILVLCGSVSNWIEKKHYQQYRFFRQDIAPFQSR